MLQTCCGRRLRGAALIVKRVLYPRLLLLSRRDSVYPYAYGFLERTRVRGSIEKLQGLRSHSGEKGDDTEITSRQPRSSLGRSWLWI